MTARKARRVDNHKFQYNTFDAVFFYHVIEHLESPLADLKILSNSLKDKGIIYIEVPNLYGSSLSDNAHKSAFSSSSLLKLMHNANFKVIDYGYASTPEESIKFDYYLSNKNENLYVLAAKKSKGCQLSSSFEVPQSIRHFKFELYLSYAKILMLTVAPRFLKISFKFIKRFFLYFAYGLLEYLTLRLFRFSFVDKIIKKNSRN